MLECCFENGDMLSKLVDAIKELASEGNLDFTPSGLQLQVMDAAHVSLCSVTLTTNAFKSYTCTQSTSLGLNFKSLSMVLRGANGPITIQFKNTDNVDIVVQKLDGTATYNLKLMDIDSEHLGIPDTQYDATCLLDAKTFTKVIKDFSDISDSCAIHIKDQLHIKARGDIGEVGWKSKNSNCVVKEPVSEQLFGTRYIHIFCKASAISDKVVIGMTEETPLCLTYPLQHGFIKYYLAPKTKD
jgi:proliferating cell nuclear antigen